MGVRVCGRYLALTRVKIEFWRPYPEIVAPYFFIALTNAGDGRGVDFVGRRGRARNRAHSIGLPEDLMDLGRERGIRPGRLGRFGLKFGFKGAGRDPRRDVLRSLKRRRGGRGR
jgi:hypothetical protein